MSCLGDEVGVDSGFWISVLGLTYGSHTVSRMKNWKHIKLQLPRMTDLFLLMVSWNKTPMEQWQRETQPWAGNHCDSQSGWEKERKVVIFLMEKESIFHPVMILKTKILIVIKKSKDSLVSWEKLLPSFSSEQMGLVFVSSIDMCLILVTVLKKICILSGF